MNKQIDGATLAVLNCYRNKYYTDGNATEQGLVANAINEVLPTLVDVKYGGYRKSTDVLGEALEILSELKESYLADDDVREACAISYAEIKIVALKQKYESEGADDDSKL